MRKTRNEKKNGSTRLGAFDGPNARRGKFVWRNRRVSPRLDWSIFRRAERSEDSFDVDAGAAANFAARKSARREAPQTATRTTPTTRRIGVDFEPRRREGKPSAAREFGAVERVGRGLAFRAPERNANLREELRYDPSLSAGGAEISSGRDRIRTRARRFSEERNKPTSKDLRANSPFASTLVPVRESYEDAYPLERNDVARRSRFPENAPSRRVRTPSTPRLNPENSGSWEARERSSKNSAVAPRVFGNAARSNVRNRAFSSTPWEKNEGRFRKSSAGAAPRFRRRDRDIDRVAFFGAAFDYAPTGRRADADRADLRRARLFGRNADSRSKSTSGSEAGTSAVERFDRAWSFRAISRGAESSANRAESSRAARTRAKFGGGYGVVAQRADVGLNGSGRFVSEDGESSAARERRRLPERVARSTVRGVGIERSSVGGAWEDARGSDGGSFSDRGLALTAIERLLKEVRDATRAVAKGQSRDVALVADWR